MYKLLKLKDGPLLMVEESDEYEHFIRPVICFEDEGMMKLGTFLEVADPNQPFYFNNIEFECFPDSRLETDYQSFVNDYLQKTE